MTPRSISVSLMPRPVPFGLVPLPGPQTAFALPKSTAAVRDAAAAEALAVAAGFDDAPAVGAASSRPQAASRTRGRTAAAVPRARRGDVSTVLLHLVGLHGCTSRPCVQTDSFQFGDAGHHGTARRAFARFRRN